MSDDYKKFENKYKVSVIVPVFNSKKYLYPCMESIVSQTLEDIQIICVDDGSTDGSLDTLNEYRRKYSNFFVMQTKHSGAAEARNKGMRKVCEKRSPRPDLIMPPQGRIRRQKRRYQNGKGSVSVFSGQR